MMMIKSMWNEKPSFRLVPTLESCIYAEGLFDPDSGVLVLISKTKKNSFTMLPKLDDNGDPVYMKVSQRRNGSPVKEERRQVEVFYEYYITDEADIKYFMKSFVMNYNEEAVTEYIANSKKVESPIITNKPEIIMP